MINHNVKIEYDDPFFSFGKGYYVVYLCAHQKMT